MCSVRVCAGGVAHPASALLAAAAVSGPPSPETSLPCSPRAPGAPPRGPGARGPDSAPPHLYRGEKGEEEGEGKEEEEEGDGGGNPVQQHQRRQSAPVRCAAPHGSGRRAAAVLSPGRSCCGLPGFLLPPRHPRSSSSSSFSLLRPTPPAARLPLRGSPGRGHPAAPPGGRGRSLLPLQLGKGWRGAEGGKNRKRGKRQQPPSAPFSS